MRKKGGPAGEGPEITIVSFNPSSAGRSHRQEKTDGEHHDTQTGRIVALLSERSPAWVELPEILDLRPRISQYSARIHQARHKWGLDIQNKVAVVGGVKRSWFRLVPSRPLVAASTTPTAVKVTPVKAVTTAAPATLPLFPEAR